MIATTLIGIPQWGNVTLIEAIWLASGLASLFVAALRMRPLWYDMQAAKAVGESDVCIIARGYLRREIIRVAQSLCVVAIGLYAATEPSAVPGPARVTLVGLVITAVLILISLLVAVQSIFDWRDRNRLGGARWTSS